MTAGLCLWKGRKLEDLSREELIEALTFMGEMYTQELRKNLDRTEPNL